MPQMVVFKLKCRYWQKSISVFGKITANILLLFVETSSFEWYITTVLEKVQRYVIKWILNDYPSDMMVYELYTWFLFLFELVIFSIACLHYLPVYMSCLGPQLIHQGVSSNIIFSHCSTSCHFYFSCLLLLWKLLSHHNLSSITTSIVS